MKSGALFVLMTTVAMAQNSDLGILGGVSGPTGSSSNVNGVKTASGSVSPSFQANYAWQLRERSTILFVETPLVLQWRLSGTAVSAPSGVYTSATSGPDLFFTPGLRLKFTPQARMSFYAALGGGFATFTGSTVTESATGITIVKRRTSAALGLGGGVDFRLTKLLSLRGEIRAFLTKSGLGGASGPAHAIGQFGIAFHL